MGHENAPPLLLDRLSDPLISSVWNVLLARLVFVYRPDGFRVEPKVSPLVGRLAVGYYSFPADELPDAWEERRDWFKKRFREECAGNWYRLYDTVSFIAEEWERLPTVGEYSDFETAINKVFVQENAGYRLVSRRVEPITGAAEIESITDALAATQAVGLDLVRTQLDTALSKLAIRPIPDYRNCIKEAISAVEAVSSVLAGKTKPDLPKALAVLEGRMKLHHQFKAAVSNLYRYASDEDGVRHGMMADPNVGLAEAKFVLVACSAIVHFLILKAQEHGMLETMN